MQRPRNCAQRFAERSESEAVAVLAGEHLERGGNAKQAPERRSVGARASSKLGDRERSVRNVVWNPEPRDLRDRLLEKPRCQQPTQRVSRTRISRHRAILVSSTIGGEQKRREIAKRKRCAMGRAGIEPATLGLKVPCSTS